MHTFATFEPALPAKMERHGNRHPFRHRIRRLPSLRVLAPLHDTPPAQAPSPTPRRGITAQDVKEFLMAYCACFMAVMGLIA